MKFSGRGVSSCHCGGSPGGWCTLTTRRSAPCQVGTPGSCSWNRIHVHLHRSKECSGKLFWCGQYSLLLCENGGTRTLIDWVRKKRVQCIVGLGMENYWNLRPATYSLPHSHWTLAWMQGHATAQGVDLPTSVRQLFTLYSPSDMSFWSLDVDNGGYGANMHGHVYSL